MVFKLVICFRSYDNANGILCDNKTHAIVFRATSKHMLWYLEQGNSTKKIHASVSSTYILKTLDLSNIS